MYYIGGDYAKFQFVDNDRLIFVIADVTGHGVSAALMVNRLHTEVELLIREGRSPGALLNELNDLIMKQFSGINIFLSAFAGLLDFKNMQLAYSNHGHPAQYIYHIRKSTVTRLSSQTTLLGLPNSEGKTYEHLLDFDKGDKILLFTDGVIEAKNKTAEPYGAERLERFIAENYTLGVEEFNQQLLNNLSNFKQGNFQDDIFILNIHAK
jgi:sigma-B regulation protein RsbU (phosphoserine phosphatase)